MSRGDLIAGYPKDQESAGKYAEGMTERNFGQTVPDVGIVLGAALNAKTLNEVAAADYVYRETILSDNYGLSTAGPATRGSPCCRSVMETLTGGSPPAPED